MFLWDKRGLMDFLELVGKRKSVRKFSEKKVDKTFILQCIEAARLAPSACNSQPWYYFVVNSKENISKIKKSAFTGVYKSMNWVCKAPVIVIIGAKPDFKANFIGTALQGTQYYIMDIGISGEHFVLQAEKLGLSTCWIGWFNSKKLKKCLKLKYKPIVMIALGYGDKSSKNSNKKIRKSIEEISKFI